jgi:hypothetical protein
MRLFRTLIIIAIIVCLLPVLSMGVAQAIADYYGCKLDLASAHPCMVGGKDIGHDLLTLGMMGWFLFSTMPVLLGFVALWVIVEIVRWAARGRTA